MKLMADKPLMFYSCNFYLGDMVLSLAMVKLSCMSFSLGLEISKSSIEDDPFLYLIFIKFQLYLIVNLLLLSNWFLSAKKALYTFLNLFQLLKDTLFALRDVDPFFCYLMAKSVFVFQDIMWF